VNHREVELELPDPEAADATIQFLYTGLLEWEMIDSNDVLFALLRNAAFLQSPALVTACCQRLGERLRLRWPEANAPLCTAPHFCPSLVPAALICAVLQDRDIRAARKVYITMAWLKGGPDEDVPSELDEMRPSLDELVGGLDFSTLQELHKRFPKSFDLVVRASAMLPSMDQDHREMRALRDRARTQECRRCQQMVAYVLREEETCLVEYHPGTYTLYQPGKRAPSLLCSLKQLLIGAHALPVTTGYGGGWSCCGEIRKRTQGCEREWEEHYLWEDGWVSDDDA
jgi:hypothetical protein